MANSFVSERVRFPTPHDQTKFLEKAILAAGSIQKLSKTLTISERTVRDWRKGKFRISRAAMKAMCDRYAIPLPDYVTFVSFEKHLKEISQKGGLGHFKKYGSVGGNKDARLAGWRKWWRKNGKKKPGAVTQPRSILKPKQSPLLAEFVGIMLGDGGLAPYHIAISLDKRSDAEYANFVESLCVTLFGVTPKRYAREYENILNVVIHRKALVSFCKDLGLPLGNKLQKKLNIPSWIKNKRSFARACVRGLIDTDGSFFVHRYHAKGRVYSYVKINFSSVSPNLLDDVHDILAESGIKTKKKYTFREVRIENTHFVEKYVRIIGSHNPKHLTVWGNNRRGG